MQAPSRQLTPLISPLLLWATTPAPVSAQAAVYSVYLQHSSPPSSSPLPSLWQPGQRRGGRPASGPRRKVDGAVNCDVAVLDFGQPATIAVMLTLESP